MIRTSFDLFSVSVDGSNEEQGKHKSVRYLFPQKKPIVGLTVTSKYDHK